MIVHDYLIFRNVSFCSVLSCAKILRFDNCKEFHFVDIIVVSVSFLSEIMVRE